VERFKFRLSKIEIISIFIIIVVLSIFFFRYNEESIHGYLFRYDRITRTVEFRQYLGSNKYTWSAKKQFKDLEHVRNYIEQMEKRQQMWMLEEQVEKLQDIESSIEAIEQKLPNP